MNRKKIIRIGLIIAATGILVGGGVAYYMYNMPHRDVQATKVDFEIQAGALVEEYLNDANAANEKYLSDNGDSKVLLVKGIVSSRDTDQNNQRVLYLKGASDKAGVSCTFITETNEHADAVKVGSEVQIKGVIRSGAAYDEDLELYEDVILEKCDIIL